LLLLGRSIVTIHVKVDSFRLLLIVASVVLAFVGLITPTSLLLLIVIELIVVSSLTEVRNILLLSVIVSVPAIVLSSSVLSTTKLINWVLRGINPQHTFNNANGLFSLEDSSFDVVDCEVFDLSARHFGAL
jgi:asparagine N-glycosylation enzyme membrane subunit Stt3